MASHNLTHMVPGYLFDFVPSTPLADDNFMFVKAVIRVPYPSIFNYGISQAGSLYTVSGAYHYPNEPQPTSHAPCACRLCLYDCPCLCHHMQANPYLNYEPYPEHADEGDKDKVKQDKHNHDDDDGDHEEYNKDIDNQDQEDYEDDQYHEYVEDDQYYEDDEADEDDEVNEDDEDNEVNEDDEVSEDDEDEDTPEDDRDSDFNPNQGDGRSDGSSDDQSDDGGDQDGDGDEGYDTDQDSDYSEGGHGRKKAKGTQRVKDDSPFASPKGKGNNGHKKAKGTQRIKDDDPFESSKGKGNNGRKKSQGAQRVKDDDPFEISEDEGYSGHKKTKGTQRVKDDDTFESLEEGGDNVDQEFDEGFGVHDRRDEPDHTAMLSAAITRFLRTTGSAPAVGGATAEATTQGATNNVQLTASEPCDVQALQQVLNSLKDQPDPQVEQSAHEGIITQTAANTPIGTGSQEANLSQNVNASEDQQGQGDQNLSSSQLGHNPVQNDGNGNGAVSPVSWAGLDMDDSYYWGHIDYTGGESMLDMIAREVADVASGQNNFDASLSTQPADSGAQVSDQDKGLQNTSPDMPSAVNLSTVQPAPDAGDQMQPALDSSGFLMQSSSSSTDQLQNAMKQQPYDDDTQIPGYDPTIYQQIYGQYPYQDPSGAFMGQPSPGVGADYGYQFGEGLEQWHPAPLDPFNNSFDMGQFYEAPLNMSENVGWNTPNQPSNSPYLNNPPENTAPYGGFAPAQPEFDTMRTFDEEFGDTNKDPPFDCINPALLSNNQTSGAPAAPSAPFMSDEDYAALISAANASLSNVTHPSDPGGLYVPAVQPHQRGDPPVAPAPYSVPILNPLNIPGAVRHTGGKVKCSDDHYASHQPTKKRRKGTVRSPDTVPPANTAPAGSAVLPTNRQPRSPTPSPYPTGDHLSVTPEQLDWADRDAGRSRNPWTQEEEQLAIDKYLNLIFARKNGTLKMTTEEMHREVSNHLQKHKYTRPAAACKNQWNRSWRAFTGVDERKRGCKDKLSTSLQGKDKTAGYKRGRSNKDESDSDDDEDEDDLFSSGDKRKRKGPKKGKDDDEDYQPGAGNKRVKT